MRTHGYRTFAPSAWATLGALAALAAGLALLVAGCSVDNPKAPRLDLQGSEVLARYVALGDGLTAGFMDAALMSEGQQTSVPALIARQMNMPRVGGMDFAQPLLASPGVGSTPLPPGTPVSLRAGTLYWSGGTISLATFPATRLVPGDLLLNATVSRPYNNLGIPGALAASLLTVRTSADPGGNGFFDLILRNSNPLFGMTTALEQAIGLRPTLATVWVGYTEILAGARSGDPDFGADPAAGDILPPSAFENFLEMLVFGLLEGVEESTGNEPLVVLANLPPVTSLPYFLPAQVFSQVYPYGYEESAALVLFPALTWIQDPANAGSPVPASLTLDAAEVTTVDTAVEGYNAAIATVAAGLDLPVVDVHAEIASWTAAQKTHFLLLVQPPTSLPPTVAAQTTYFSLDGLHPNNRGYAVLANAFIAAINAAAGTAIPAVDPATVAWDPTHGIAPTLAGD